jgi:hypothetical protein
MRYIRTSCYRCRSATLHWIHAPIALKPLTEREMLTPARETSMEELMEEDRRLRERVWELEMRVEELEEELGWEKEWSEELARFHRERVMEVVPYKFNMIRPIAEMISKRFEQLPVTQTIEGEYIMKDMDARYFDIVMKEYKGVKEFRSLRAWAEYNCGSYDMANQFERWAFSTILDTTLVSTVPRLWNRLGNGDRGELQETDDMAMSCEYMMARWKDHLMNECRAVTQKHRSQTWDLIEAKRNAKKNVGWEGWWR